MNFSATKSGQVQIMQRFYRWQAKVYNSTRWAFLFGRRKLLRQLPQQERQTLIEVGCGTGWNLNFLAKKHRQWTLIGIDVSPEMLNEAAKVARNYGPRIQLQQQAYDADDTRSSVDLLLFSYCLTMFNPGWEAAIEQAWKDLKPGGYIAVVDFHDTRQAWFRRWMEGNHVRMDGHLLPFLEQHFQAQFQEVNAGYGWFWRYFLFIGKKL